MLRIRIKEFRYEELVLPDRRGVRGQLLSKECFACGVFLKVGEKYLQEWLVYNTGKVKKGRIFCMDQKKKCKEKSISFFGLL